VSGGLLVKILRYFLLLVVLGSSCVAAQADGIDPKFVPIGGRGSIILTSPTDPAFQFSFTKNGSVGTVDCGSFGGPSDNQCINPENTEFVNFSHQTWTSITLDFTQHSAGLIFTPFDNADTIDPYFLHSASGFLENGDPFVTFFGTDSTHPGIESADSCVPQEEGPPICSGPTMGSLYLFDFSVLSDVTDMSDGQSFATQGSATTPEPATVLFALAGGVVLFLLKRP
jgi:hypothetical protein